MDGAEDLGKSLREIIKKPPKLICSDIDGVLTVTRGNFLLDLDLMKKFRHLREMGVLTCLASANSYPVVMTLVRYLDLDKILIAEGGCIINVNGEVIHLTEKEAKSIGVELAKSFGLETSWQNRYRHHDIALTFPRNLPLKEVEKGIQRIREYVARNYPGFKLVYSGYAMHVVPEECDKGSALQEIITRLGLGSDDVIAVGDSSVDSSMLKVAGIGVAPLDADDYAKGAADIVIPKKASEATHQLIDHVIRLLREH